MRILHVISALPTGGAERMLVKLIQNDVSETEHIVISLKDKGTQGEILEKLGIKVLTIGVKGSFPTLKHIFKVRKLIKQIEPCVIQGWMYHGNLASLATGFSTPVVFNIRHSLSDIKNEKPTTRWIIKLNAFLSKKVDKIIYNSYLSEKQHVEYGFDQSKSVVLSNGFDTNMFDINIDNRRSLRKELNLADDTFVFCQIGRDHPVKDHPSYIKAAAIVLKQHENCHFILVGEGVNTNEELQFLIKNLNLSNNFTLLGERADISTIWNGADIAVLSSLGEAFPNVVGEAMACGKPCVVTDVGDAAFMIGDTGVVVKPGDINGLANAMQKFISLNPREYEYLSRKARQRIVKNFKIEKVSTRYIDLYRQILMKDQRNAKR